MKRPPLTLSQLLNLSTSDLPAVPPIYMPSYDGHYRHC